MNDATPNTSSMVEITHSRVWADEYIDTYTLDGIPVAAESVVSRVTDGTTRYYVSATQAYIIRTAAASTHKSNSEALARADRYRDRLCPKCGTMCYGDCEA